MKVSQEQKNVIRQKLLAAATDLFAAKGFAAVTMREISTTAGFSAGTIYSYFPSKEQIFYAYFDQKQDDLFASLAEIEDFESFTLKEKLQTLIEMQLEMYLKDRSFVAVTFKALLDSPMRSFTELRPTQDRFTAQVTRFLTEAIHRGEVAVQPFEAFVCNLFWDYKNLIVLYWLKDETVGFVHTSKMIDMTLDIYIDIIKSGLVGKVADVALFLVKSHLYGNIEKLLALSSLFGGPKAAPFVPEK